MNQLIYLQKYFPRTYVAQNDNDNQLYVCLNGNRVYSFLARDMRDRNTIIKDILVWCSFGFMTGTLCLDDFNHYSGLQFNKTDIQNIYDVIGNGNNPNIAEKFQNQNFDITIIYHAKT